MKYDFQVQSVSTDFRNMTAHVFLNTPIVNGRTVGITINGLDISSLANLKASDVDEATVKLCRDILRKAAEADYQ